MTWYLFLDDVRDPRDVYKNWHRPWTVCRSSQEAIDLVRKRGLPSVMSLDFDLGGPDTALVFLKDLSSCYLDGPIPAYAIHSANVVGRKDLASYVQSWARARRLPLKRFSDSKGMVGQADVVVPCQRPPTGWSCTQLDGHDGPCPAWPDDPRSVPPAARATVADVGPVSPKDSKDEGLAVDSPCGWCKKERYVCVRCTAPRSECECAVPSWRNNHVAQPSVLQECTKCSIDHGQEACGLAFELGRRIEEMSDEAQLENELAVARTQEDMDRFKDLYQDRDDLRRENTQLSLRLLVEQERREAAVDLAERAQKTAEKVMGKLEETEKQRKQNAADYLNLRDVHYQVMEARDSLARKLEKAEKELRELKAPRRHWPKLWW